MKNTSVQTYPEWENFEKSISPFLKSLGYRVMMQAEEDSRCLCEMIAEVADTIDDILTPEIEIHIEAPPENEGEDAIAINKFFRHSEEAVELEIGPRFYASCSCGWTQGPIETKNIMDAYKMAQSRHAPNFIPKNCRLIVYRSPLH